MQNQNLELYNRVREVPSDAQKTIGAGRLKGMTDINPMWRIKKLTEEFGPVGTGWYIDILEQWSEDGADGVKMVFVKIALYYKNDKGWNQPVLGIGGSQLVAKESKGMYNDDESYKKALTDAIGGACKLLGIGADIYWDKDRTKYDRPPEEKTQTTQKQAENKGTNAKKQEVKQQAAEIEEVKNAPISDLQIQTILGLCTQKGFSHKAIEGGYKKQLKELTSEEATKSIIRLQKMDDLPKDTTGNQISSDQILEIMDLAKVKNIAVTAIEDKYSKKIPQFNGSDYAKAMGFLKGM